MALTQSPPPLRPSPAATSLPPSPEPDGTAGPTQDDELLLDASLQDFESPPSPSTEATSSASTHPSSTRPSSVLPGSEFAPEEDIHHLQGQHHHQSPPPSSPSNLDAESEADSAAGGFSPPAWRKLDNGRRSAGFWKGRLHDGPALGATALGYQLTDPSSPIANAGNSVGEKEDDDSDIGNASDTTSILQRAIRTRLPRGSQSPVKMRSPNPEAQDDTIKVESLAPALTVASPPREAPSDNYFRIALRAEVQQRTEPIEATVSFLRKRYQAVTSSWLAVIINTLIALLSILFVKTLLQPVASRPAGDLVKVAGVARSFEPLIYYSENAVAQVHDLQATSVAVWDLGESVRSSDMRDAASIVSDLDALSETMRTLSVEMTKFFARVDGDVDGILNVMDWARMHLSRLHNAPAPSTISAAYDNIHNMLSQARVLEDAQGTPTPLGNLATRVFGLSNPQREQRLIQLLFTEFLTVLEDSIAAELQHSVTLFALFEAVDRHFLNLARAVVRESSAQEALHADALAGLWVRLLGARANELAKFARNRDLLRDVRDKTVRNKRVLIDHHGRLLTLKASLESLRGRLVSPLVRGVANSSGATATLLSLEDQIHGITSVSEYLADLRRHQKGRIMETLFAGVPGQRIPVTGGGATSGGEIGGFDAHGKRI